MLKAEANGDMVTRVNMEVTADCLFELLGPSLQHLLVFILFLYHLEMKVEKLKCTLHHMQQERTVNHLVPTVYGA